MLNPSNSKNKGLMILSLFVALILTIAPFPLWAIWLKPAWLALIVIYWRVTSPSLMSLGFAWFLGLLLDVIQGTLFGEYALAMVIVAYLAAKLQARMRFFPIPQQTILVFVILALYQLTLLVIQGMLGQFNNTKQFLLPAVTGMLVWPMIVLCLQGLGAKTEIRRYSSPDYLN